MVTLVLPRLVTFEAMGRRSGSVVERNIAALKSAYWLVMVSGLLEPVFYLLSIGVGVGELVGDIALPTGQLVSYAAFVGPAMLAASAMTGALAETTFNFFGKMKYMKLYDAVLATPVRPIEIALGELSWAMIRGTLYSAAFVAVMVVMELTTPVRAIAALPATVLVGFSFGALGMVLSTWMRSWQDFDLMFAVQFALFLFSGTFVPAESYPVALRWLVELSPLYQSVSLIRGISTGVVGWQQLGNVLYLVLIAVVSLLVASRGIERKLCK